MIRLGQWSAGPVAVLALAWIGCSAAGLTLWLIALARGFERSLESAGFALGATEAEFRVGIEWASLEIGGFYATVVLSPPAVLWLLWRRGRRRAERQQREIIERAI